MKRKVAWVLTVLIFVGVGIFCVPEKPLVTDSMVKREFVVYDTTGLYDPTDTTRMTPVANAKVILNSKDYVKQYVYYTDDSGRVDISNILASTYEVNVSYAIGPGLMLVSGKVFEFYDPHEEVDTLLLTAVSPAPLVINEIYYCGPKNNIFFFFDQYIELFNRTDSIIYLDGMILARIRSSKEIRPIKDTLSYVQNVFAFKFPGTPGEKNWPIYPGQFIVVASDAYDHSQTLSNAINLENADFEFYNQYSGDYDNPDVPNLTNLIPSKRPDFLISVVSDGVVLADGTRWELVTLATEYGTSDYINLPIETIIDGVEYKSGTTRPKDLTYRIDAGYTGVGVTRYSGKSVERINPYMDTNNSTVDFHILDHPTPGYKAD